MKETHSYLRPESCRVMRVSVGLVWTAGPSVLSVRRCKQAAVTEAEGTRGTKGRKKYE